MTNRDVPGHVVVDKLKLPPVEGQIQPIAGFRIAAQADAGPRA